VLWDSTSRGWCGLVFSLRNSERGGKKEGEKKRSARGSVHQGCDYASSLNIEVDPQHRCFKSDFALQRRVECRASKPERVRDVLLRRHSSGSEVRLGLLVGL
jgi:hypothetical protein